ncbi:MAG TPA: hypothetical protein VLQ93_17065 [Myxococcaceae bacterium]|nr:hypothetical protein [Myxococcaceae bacterium]
MVGTVLVALAELAYAFIDYQVYRGSWFLPVLRALHSAWALLLLGLLLGRRHRLTRAGLDAAFAGAVLPFLPLFALAEQAMAASGVTWVPMTGHRLVMLAIGVLAPTRLRLGGGLIGAFALEVLVLWYGLALGERLPDIPWEPWVTLIYGGVALTLLVYRVRSHRMEVRLRQARAEAEALERLARLFLVVRDAANTPLQTLELSLAVLRRRSPGSEPTMASMERAVRRLRGLIHRLSGADPLLVWREGEESFDAEAILRLLEGELARELERRRH